jgi:SAM-dependent methyltransferase
MPESSMFDTLASAYAAGRPSYPDEILDAVQDLSGRPLAGARIADVGAGTGIATRQLRDRGAHVTAVELSEPMLRQLVSQSPGVTAVLGSANTLPLRTASVDFVTFGQAWHWVDPDLAVPEVLRVLKPGGALACFWNQAVPEGPWAGGYDRRVQDFLGYDYRYGSSRNASQRPGSPPTLDLGARTDLEVRSVTARWTRTVPVDALVADISSRSFASTVTRERLEGFLDGERDILLAAFPDGQVVEAYTTWLGVVRAR